ASERVDARVQRDDAQHADADDRGAVADRRGHERLLDAVLADGEQTLGDRLVADRVREHGRDVWSALMKEGFEGEEVRLLGGPPAAKKITGMMTTTAPSIAQTCARSVSTEARKPDHSVYSSTPAAIATMPWVNVNGESIEMSAPPAMRLEVRLMRLPSTLEPA